jgi:hypothetical protein
MILAKWCTRKLLPDEGLPDGLGAGGQEAVQDALAGWGLDDPAPPATRGPAQELLRQAWTPPNICSRLANPLIFVLCSRGGGVCLVPPSPPLTPPHYIIFTPPPWPQSTYITRVLQCLSPRPNWMGSPTPSLATECILPGTKRGWDTLACGWGEGGRVIILIRTTGEKA